jgi:aspartyl-tRNA synthetase
MSDFVLYRCNHGIVAPFTSLRESDHVTHGLLAEHNSYKSVKAQHYDLVVNGVELGGGSRRIHDAAVQEFIFRDILKMGSWVR